MKRKPFSQVLKDAKVDIKREYDRLYAMFCIHKVTNINGIEMTLKEICAANFINLPFRVTCITLEDFDDFYGYNFEKEPDDFDLDYLVRFCEYSYNLSAYNQGFAYGMPMTGVEGAVHIYIQQVIRVVDAIGYTGNVKDGVTDFVPKDQAAISVSEIVEPDLSYKVIEYNHHSMKGNLDQKKAIIRALADKLEPQRKKLKAINTSLESYLFNLFNTVNIRHNNIVKGSKNYIQLVAEMDNNELEKWYDDTYQMCLLAFLELDNVERKTRIKKLKEDIEKRKDSKSN